jgi:hormone-sensitive lipase
MYCINYVELSQKVPSLICPSVRVNHVFTLAPDAFDMMRSDGSETITVTAPCANTGPAPVCVRLLSHDLRQGQVRNFKFHNS